MAINGKGFMLRGAPMTPHYSKSNAVSLITSFRVQHEVNIVDFGANEFTGANWNYWLQTDWSGGFQQLKWEDNASFKDGQAIEVVRKYGEISLQNGITSAYQLSGTQSYGAHAVHSTDLILGTIKSGAAKVYKMTSAYSVSVLSAYAGISAVNSMDRFNNNTILGMTRTSGTLKTLAKYTGSAVSGFRSANPIVRAVHGIGIRLYTGERVASLSGDVLYYTTDLSTFTSAYQAGKNRNIYRIEDLNGAPYFFVVEGKKVDLFRWDEFASRAYPIYTWDNLTNFSTKQFIGIMTITGSSNGKSVAYAFNGARIWSIFNDQLLDSSYDFSHPFEYQQNLQVKGALWDGEFWSPGLYGKLDASRQYTYFENFNNVPVGFAISGSKTFLGRQDATKYAISGFMESSEYGSIIGGVDKLVNCVDINTKALATGQTVEVFRSTDSGVSFQSIGKASYAQDGAVTKKKLYFPSGFVTKLWEHKAVLVGPGTSTPTVLDISFQYRPVTDVKRNWKLSLDAGDNIKLLNNQQEQRDGKALMQDMWVEMETKKIVTYEDVDAFEVNLVSAMTATATSARVNNTRLMPPRGRIRVLKNSVAEEMIYTSADGGKILGITRGSQSTLPRAYTSADKMDNYYNVIVTNIAEQLLGTDQNKTESTAQVVLLEV